MKTYKQTFKSSLIVTSLFLYGVLVLSCFGNQVEMFENCIVIFVAWFSVVLVAFYLPGDIRRVLEPMAKAVRQKTICVIVPSKVYRLGFNVLPVGLPDSITDCVLVHLVKPPVAPPATT